METIQAYTQMPQSLAQRASSNRRSITLDAKRSASAKPVLANGIPWEAGVRSWQGYGAECCDNVEMSGNSYWRAFETMEALWHYFKGRL